MFTDTKGPLPAPQLEEEGQEQAPAGLDPLSRDDAGPAGATGPTGATGAAGANGATGPSGPSGTSVAAASNLTPVTVSANTTADQTLQEVTLTAGFFNTVKAANIIHGSGRLTIAIAQTPTLTFKAKLCTVSGCGSGTVVTLASITSGASIAATNNGWNLQLMAGTVSTGATGTLEVHGAPGLVVDIGALPGTAATPYTDTNTTVSAPIDLTAALFVDFTIATSVGNTGNAITQDIAEVLPQGAGGGGGGSGTVTAPYVTLNTTAGPIFALTPPGPVGNFTFINQGGATSYGANGALGISAPATATENMRILIQAAPATPYTKTAKFIFNSQGIANTRCGSVFRESSTGKLIPYWFIASATAGLYSYTIDKFTNPTTYAGSSYNPLGFASTPPNATDAFFRMADDGVNLTWSWSKDGIVFTQQDQRLRTDFMAGGPDQIGFVTEPEQATAGTNCLLIGWN